MNIGKHTFIAKQSRCIWGVIGVSACHHKANSWLVRIIYRNQILNTRGYYEYKYYDILQGKGKKTSVKQIAYMPVGSTYIKFITQVII